MIFVIAPDPKGQACSREAREPLHQPPPLRPRGRDAASPARVVLASTPPQCPRRTLPPRLALASRRRSALPRAFARPHRRPRRSALGAAQHTLRRRPPVAGRLGLKGMVAGLLAVDCYIKPSPLARPNNRWLAQFSPWRKKSGEAKRILSQFTAA